MSAEASAGSTGSGCLDGPCGSGAEEEAEIAAMSKLASGLHRLRRSPWEVLWSALTVVMKFGGSSLASAERMREVAELILSFPDETPVVVLSAMGKTTNNLLLAGEKAVRCGAPKASEIPELSVIKELHLRTIDELGLDRSIVSDTFKLTLQFTEEYPNKPPTVRLVSRMFHPNIYADGSICLDILQNQWSPIYDVAAILIHPVDVV